MMNCQPLSSKVSRNLKISETVIIEIAKQAALEMEGVTGLLPLPMEIKNYLIKARRAQTVKMEFNNGTVRLSIGIQLAFGISIEKIATKLQEAIKFNIQNMTGLPVSQVNIYIMGMQVN